MPPLRKRRTPEQLQRRAIQLLVGLLMYGLGIALLVSSDLGASPWDVLTQGISHHVPLTFGTITVIMSVLVLLFWIPLHQKPGIGTVLNTLLVGPAADIGFLLVPEAHALWVRIVFMVSGIVVIGIATGLYIGSRFGPGPRDGLMTGLHRLTGRPIWQVRGTIELIVVTCGWILGGTVGVGTLAFAVLIGPVCQYFMQLLSVRLQSDAVPNIVATVPEEARLAEVPTLRMDENPA